jgi:hypothetical protein
MVSGEKLLRTNFFGIRILQLSTLNVTDTQHDVTSFILSCHMQERSLIKPAGLSMSQKNICTDYLYSNYTQHTVLSELFSTYSYFKRYRQNIMLCYFFNASMPMQEHEEKTL